MVFKKKDISTPPPDISPRETGIFKSKKKTRFQRGNLGNAQLRKMGYQGKRAPDRPWAFRRGIPPSVVYRGAPPELGLASPIPGFPLDFATFPVFAYISLWRARFGSKPPCQGLSGPFSGRQTAPDPIIRPRQTPSSADLAPDLSKTTLCAHQIIFGKIHPLEMLFLVWFVWFCAFTF